MNIDFFGNNSLDKLLALIKSMKDSLTTAIGNKSKVTFTRNQTSGTKVGTINIDGINYDIYAPDPTTQVQADWDVDDREAPDYIKNKPNLNVFVKKDGDTMTGDLWVGDDAESATRIEPGRIKIGDSSDAGYRIEFGDGNIVYIAEEEDDVLTIKANTIVLRTMDVVLDYRMKIPLANIRRYNKLAFGNNTEIERYKAMETTANKSFTRSVAGEFRLYVSNFSDDSTWDVLDSYESALVESAIPNGNCYFRDSNNHFFEITNCYVDDEGDAGSPDYYFTAFDIVIPSGVTFTCRANSNVGIYVDGGLYQGVENWTLFSNNGGLTINNKQVVVGGKSDSTTYNSSDTVATSKAVYNAAYPTKVYDSGGIVAYKIGRIMIVNFERYAYPGNTVVLSGVTRPAVPYANFQMMVGSTVRRCTFGYSGSNAAFWTDNNVAGSCSGSVVYVSIS